MWYIWVGIVLYLIYFIGMILLFSTSNENPQILDILELFSVLFAGIIILAIWPLIILGTIIYYVGTLLRSKKW